MQGAYFFLRLSTLQNKFIWVFEWPLAIQKPKESRLTEYLVTFLQRNSSSNPSLSNTSRKALIARDRLS